MRKLFAALALILAACSFFTACGETQVASSPLVSNTAVAAPTPKPTPAATPTPVSEEEEEIDYYEKEKILERLQEYYNYEIEEAEKYRVKVGDTEYYFDTGSFVEIFPYYIEFPLYRLKDGDDWPEYLGTTGFAFQVFGDYIYVRSDPLQDDWPDGTLTRVVDLKDLSVTQAGRNMYIFTPEEGNKVYYTKSADCIIYIADASLKNPKKICIEVPDKKAVDEIVEELCGYDPDDLGGISITNVRGGWIYFTYRMCEYEGPLYYEGDYRIKVDGSEIENVGEGKFGDEIDN